MGGGRRQVKDDVDVGTAEKVVDLERLDAPFGGAPLRTVPVAGGDGDDAAVTHPRRVPHIHVGDRTDADHPHADHGSPAWTAQTEPRAAHCERHVSFRAAADGDRRHWPVAGGDTQAMDSAFQRAGGQAADELPLQGEVDEDDRNKRDDQPGTERGIIGPILPNRLKYR